jgi:hypothetical protein
VGKKKKAEYFIAVTSGVYRAKLILKKTLQKYWHLSFYSKPSLLLV